MEGVGRHKVGRLSQLLRGYKEIKKNLKTKEKKVQRYIRQLYIWYLFFIIYQCCGVEVICNLEVAPEPKLSF